MTVLSRFSPRVLLALLCSGLLALSARADDARFSSTLTPGQRVELGLDTLTSDNLAVIDGLVRQDEAASKFKNNGVDHTRFSERRTTHERTIAGLDHLDPAQLAQLDQLVHRRIAGPEPEAELTAAGPARPAGSGVKIDTKPRPLEIHGEISYTYGWSKAGSYQGGGLVLTYDDPADRFSILVGYSEYHGKGLPWCIYPGGGPYLP